MNNDTADANEEVPQETEEEEDRTTSQTFEVAIAETDVNSGSVVEYDTSVAGDIPIEMEGGEVVTETTEGEVITEGTIPVEESYEESIVTSGLLAVTEDGEYIALSAEDAMKLGSGDTIIITSDQGGVNISEVVIPETVMETEEIAETETVAAVSEVNTSETQDNATQEDVGMEEETADEQEVGDMEASEEITSETAAETPDGKQATCGVCGVTLSKPYQVRVGDLSCHLHTDFAWLFQRKIPTRSVSGCSFGCSRKKSNYMISVWLFSGSHQESSHSACAEGSVLQLSPAILQHCAVRLVRTCKVHAYMLSFSVSGVIGSSLF